MTHIRFLIPALALGGLLATPALSQQGGHDAHHGSQQSAPQAEATPTELPWAEAEIRRVDLAAGKLSLRHGEIKNLAMPPMTMVFTVQDTSSLGDLKAGDRIRFKADQILGAYTVMRLEKLP